MAECIGVPLTQEWSGDFIGVGYFASVFGAFVGLSTITYALTVLKHPAFAHWFYVFVASSGMSIGGSSIWTMHFVGMRALTVVRCDGVPVPKKYNVVLTVISLVAAVVIGAFCMYLVMPMKPAKQDGDPEAAEKVKRRTDKLEYWPTPFTFRGTIVKIVKFDLLRFAGATLTLMVGVCVMHYMGMIAQQGPYVKHFSPGVITASAVIALVASAAGLFIVVQVAVMGQVNSIGPRAVAAVIIGVAVNAMHYTGMFSATYVYTGDDTSSLTHGFGPAMSVDPLVVCIISLTVGIMQLVVCQHYSEKLYVRQQAINDALARKLPKDVGEKLKQIYDAVLPNDGGAVANYIPELAAADPNRFGIVICDVNGEVHAVGDSTEPVTIQSCCKPMLYMLALEMAGVETVSAKIGTEPSGQPFDALSIDSTDKAYNPFVNAGAIASAGILLSTPGGAEDADGVYSIAEAVCRDMSKEGVRQRLDRKVLASESETNSNNRWIAEELGKKKIVEGNTAAALDAYTMACSMLTTAEDTAVMAATLANGGRNPLTKEEIFDTEIVEHTVTVMMSCGMYNGAGKWITDVGIPAKSGVAGLVMGVVPGVCGIGIFSPRLDANGNSTRGVAVAKMASERLDLHVLKKQKKKGPLGLSPSKNTRRTQDSVSVFSSQGSVDVHGDSFQQTPPKHGGGLRVSAENWLSNMTGGKSADHLAADDASGNGAPKARYMRKSPRGSVEGLSESTSRATSPAWTPSRAHSRAPPSAAPLAHGAPAADAVVHFGAADAPVTTRVTLSPAAELTDLNV